MPTTVYQRQNGEDVLGETEPATRSGAERGATSLLTRHAVGLAALVLTMASAYMASRPNTPQNAQEVARLTDDSAEEATDETTVVEIEAHIREIAVRYRISPHLVAAIVEEFSRALGRVDVHTLPIPHDCVDGFLGAYWRRPHAYLDASVRGAISTFSKIPPSKPG